MDYKILTIIIIVFIIVAITRTTENYRNKSFCMAKDGNYYMVQNYKDRQKAANLLARVNRRIKYFLEHLRGRYYNNRDVLRLYRNYNEHQISENHSTSNNTTYSINKGEKIVFCLRHKHAHLKNDLVDINTIMFVAIHELAHLMSHSIGPVSYTHLDVYKRQTASRAYRRQ